MNPPDGTAPSEAGPLSLSLEFDLRHPPEKVWRALTDPALLAAWLLPVAGFRPEAGTDFTFRTDPHPGWDGTVRCRVLEVEAPRRLRCSWVVGDGEIDTVVTFTLERTASGTRLALVQSGFRPDQGQALGGARYGWTMMGGKLVDLLGRIP